MFLEDFTFFLGLEYCHSDVKMNSKHSWDPLSLEIINQTYRCSFLVISQLSYGNLSFV